MANPPREPDACGDTPLGELERRLIDAFQRDMPLVARPYGAVADNLGCSEQAVLEALGGLLADGAVSRVGPVFAPNRAGASTLAAMAVPDGRLEDVAALVNEYSEVNHNYEREHHYSLWFVVTATDRARVDEVLADIGRRTGLAVLDLPLVEAYHIDLGFPVQWS